MCCVFHYHNAHTTYNQRFSWNVLAQGLPTRDIIKMEKDDAVEAFLKQVRKLT